MLKGLMVFGSDRELSDDISIRSFTKFGSP